MTKNNPLAQRVWALFWGLLINAFGNGLTVATNLGTSPWTASEVNLGHLLGVSVGWPMLVIGTITAGVNQVLSQHWDRWRFIGEVVFIGCFSYLVNGFVALFTRLGIPQLPWLVKLAICFSGIVIFCIAISLYQRANLIMHPNDDTTNIVRFRYFHGRVVPAQIVVFLVPIAIMVVTFVMSHQLYSVNLGMLFCVFFNGPLISFADRHVWPKLRHNFRVVAKN